MTFLKLIELINLKFFIRKKNRVLFFSIMTKKNNKIAKLD